MRINLAENNDGTKRATHVILSSEEVKKVEAAYVLLHGFINNNNFSPDTYIPCFPSEIEMVLRVLNINFSKVEFTES